SKERARLIKITRQPPDRDCKEVSEVPNRPKHRKINGFGSATCSDTLVSTSQVSEQASEENTNEINASDTSDTSDTNLHTQSAAAAGDEPVNISLPNSAIRIFTVGSASTALTSRLSRSTISAGVPLGTPMPSQPVTA